MAVSAKTGTALATGTREVVGRAAGARVMMTTRTREVVGRADGARVMMATIRFEDWVHVEHGQCSFDVKGGCFENGSNDGILRPRFEVVFV